MLKGILIENIYNGNQYHVMDSEISNDLVNLYIKRSYGLIVEKVVSKDTLQRDYIELAQFEY